MDRCGPPPAQRAPRCASGRRGSGSYKGLGLGACGCIGFNVFGLGVQGSGLRIRVEDSGFGMQGSSLCLALLSVVIFDRGPFWDGMEQFGNPSDNPKLETASQQSTSAGAHSQLKTLHDHDILQLGDPQGRGFRGHVEIVFQQW